MVKPAYSDGASCMWLSGARISEVRDEFVVRVGRFVHIEVIKAAGDYVATLPPEEVSADDLTMQGFGLLHRATAAKI